MPTHQVIAAQQRIRSDLMVLDAEFARFDEAKALLRRIRAYLNTDGEALAPQAAALVGEINAVLGEPQ